MQGGLQHFVIGGGGGGKNCMDMDTCSMHVHSTSSKEIHISKMNQSISCALHEKL